MTGQRAVYRVAGGLPRSHCQICASYQADMRVIFLRIKSVILISSIVGASVKLN